MTDESAWIDLDGFATAVGIIVGTVAGAAISVSTQSSVGVPAGLAIAAVIALEYSARRR
jgi:hypothetical protein